MVERDGDEEIDLNNGITIEIQTASFRSVRGYTLIAALCDEIALLFGPWFKKPATWAAWRVFLSALFGLPIDGDGLDLFRRSTGLPTDERRNRF